MSRPLTDDMRAALLAPTTRPMFLFEGTFKGGTINLWTGIGPLQWDDKLWSGVGNVIELSPMEETDDIKAGGMQVTLAGVTTEYISLALAEMQRNRPGAIFLGLLTEAGEVIPDPKTILRGRLDVCGLQDKGETSSLILNYENELIDLQRPREVRYTDEEQRRLYPDDRGLEYVASMVDKTIRWGSTS